jgi:endonuclease YncB( thermonuclease family)
MPTPEPVNLEHPTVLDTADLKAGDTVVALYGVEGLQGDAAQGLQGFLASAGNRVTCQAQPAGGSMCLLPDGTDLAEAALVNGAARTKDDAPDAYRNQEAAAQAARRGIWASLPPPPATLTHPVVQDTATLVADGQTYVLDGVIGLGQPFAGQLQGYITGTGGTLFCQPQIEPGEYVCMTKDGTDIAKVALVNGAARVDADAPDSYREQQLDALNNRRGFWVNPPPDMVLAASAMQPVDACCAYDPGDNGVDGITYVGGEPEAIVDGESVFFLYGGDYGGWGYYDHWHHWRGAPDRFRHHLEHFHPGGHGLRGYGHNAELRHDAVVRREDVRRNDALRHDVAARPGGIGGGRPGFAGEAGRPGFAGAARAGEAGRPGFAGAARPGEVNRPGFAGAARPGENGRPGFAGAGRPGEGARPGFAGATAARPGFAGTAGARPGFAGAAVRPGFAGGGFVHPGVSAGGFHPGGLGGGGGGFHPSAAPAAHVSASGGGGRKK